MLSTMLSTVKTKTSRPGPNVAPNESTILRSYCIASRERWATRNQTRIPKSERYWSAKLTVLFITVMTNNEAYLNNATLSLYSQWNIKQVNSDLSREKDGVNGVQMESELPVSNQMVLFTNVNSQCNINQVYTDLSNQWVLFTNVNSQCQVQDLHSDSHWRGMTQTGLVAH